MHLNLIAIFIPLSLVWSSTPAQNNDTTLPEEWNTIFVVAHHKSDEGERLYPVMNILHYWELDQSEFPRSLTRAQCREKLYDRYMGDSEAYERLVFIWCDTLNDIKVSERDGNFEFQGFRFFGPGNYRALPPLSDEKCMALNLEEQQIDSHRTYMCGYSDSKWTSTWQP